MCATDDGFRLAEKDMELRGAGDLLGTRQSGLPEMSYALHHFSTEKVTRAQRAAERVLTEDPELELPEHRILRQRFEEFWAKAGGGVAA